MMARFDLSKYATVAERLVQWQASWPDGRIETEIVSLTESQPRVVVVKASVYYTAGDQANRLPAATGHATETEGGAGANSVDFIANGETSSVGRALSLCGFAANKDTKTLASRQEMEKVERITNRDFISEADRITDVESLRMLYAQAKAAGASAQVLEKVKAHGEALGASGKDSGAGASVPSKSAKG
tara:strand:- start:1601 stop:2161 length:561 start_codon:yes stop_codon:yes gene_type:complete